MDRNPIKRWRLSAAWMVVALLGIPALADAQLFPNLPTRNRQRPASESEPPIYKTTRHQYYGYFPTCWRKFPNGWGCPCGHPEPPGNWAEERLKKPSTLTGEAPPTDRETPVDGPSGRNPGSGPTVTTPPLPTERDPFSIQDSNLPAASPATLPGPAPTAPAPPPPGNGPAPMPPSASLPSAGADPFEVRIADVPISRPATALLDPGFPSTPSAPPVPMEMAEPLPTLPAPAVSAPAAPRRSLLSGLFDRFRR